MEQDLRKGLAQVLILRALPFRLSSKSQLFLNSINKKQLFLSVCMCMNIFGRAVYLVIRFTRYLSIKSTLARQERMSLKDFTLTAAYTLIYIFITIFCLHTIRNYEKLRYFFNQSMHWSLIKWNLLNSNKSKEQKQHVTSSSKVIHFITRFYIYLVPVTSFVVNFDDPYSQRYFCSLVTGYCQSHIGAHIIIMIHSSLVDTMMFQFLQFYIMLHLSYTEMTSKRFALQCKDLRQNSSPEKDRHHSWETQLLIHRAEQILNQQFNLMMSHVILPASLFLLLASSVAACLISVHMNHQLPTIIFLFVLLTNIALLVFVNGGFNSSTALNTFSIKYLRAAKLHFAGTQVDVKYRNKVAAMIWDSARPLKVKVKNFLFFERMTVIRLYGMILYLVMKISTMI